MSNKYKTIIILDWDDTLFPTSWLLQNNINMNDEEVRKKYFKNFAKLDNIVSKLLLKCLQSGTVIIVTNALPIWIKVSSSVLPETVKMFKSIKIISARHQYQEHSNNMMDWKAMAFKDELAQIITAKKVHNIISIGDAEYEYKALIDLYNWNKKNKKILKSIKLMRHPSIEQIYDELSVLDGTMNYITTHEGHLDLNFQNH